MNGAWARRRDAPIRQVSSTTFRGLKNRWNSLRKWFALRNKVQNWWRSWWVSTSRNAWRALDARALASGVHTVRFRNGMALSFDANQWHDMHGFCGTCDRYLDPLEEALPDHGVVVDVGAHVGTFCIPLCHRYKHIRCIAFEPDPENFKRLHLNAAANGLIDGRLTLVNAAVAGENGTVTFCVGATSTLGTLSHSKYIKNRVRTPLGEIEVECVGMNEVFHMYGISHCDLVKLDCEGGEYPIFDANPSGWLKHTSGIIVELHPVEGRSMDLIRRHVGDEGFSVQEKQFRNGCVELVAARNQRTLA